MITKKLFGYAFVATTLLTTVFAANADVPLLVTTDNQESQDNKGSEILHREVPVPRSAAAANPSPMPSIVVSVEEAKVLPSAEPEEMGVDPKAIAAMIAHLDHVKPPDTVKEPPAFIKNTLGGHDLHSLLIMRHGKVIYEYYRPPYQMDRPHFIWSCSKSFAALAVGFAVQEGKLDINEKLVDIFADQVAKFPTPPDERAKKITVRNVLMMQTGHIGDAKPIPDRITGFLLEKSPREPGSAFSYDTAGVCMLAYVIQAKTGEPLEKFLAKHLFEPLGIVRADWSRDKGGVVDCGAGLSLRPRDLAKVGLLLLNKGKWNGQQLLSEEWIKEATTVPADAKSSYGYLFWVHKDTNSFYMLGNCGQFVIVLPGYDMVIVTVSNFDFKDTKAPLDAVYDLLLPTVKK